MPATDDRLAFAERSNPRTLNTGRVSHFTVRLLSDTPPEEAERLRRTLERTHAVFYDVVARAGFDPEPLSEPLVWLVFADRQEYDRYTWRTEGMGAPDLDGYYSPRTNRVALLFCKYPVAENRVDEARWTPVLEGGILPPKPPNGYMGEPPPASTEREAHEAAHQLAFNSGLQKRGVMYPFWVAEGLATGFETRSPLGPGAINRMRCRHLLSARRSGSLVPLREFLPQVDVRLENTPQAQQSYGQAWGVFHYLFTEHPARLRRYLRELADLPPGRQPLRVREEHVAAALGPLDDLEAGWEEMLNRLDTALEEGEGVARGASPSTDGAPLAGRDR